MKLKIHKNYCSHVPALIKALSMVDGDVLEMGSGIYSTFLLHWLCLEQDRLLFTYENYERYYELIEHCSSDTHKVILVDDWDKAEIERDWAVALVDHAPALRRKEDIRRLAHHAQCIVIHDTQGRSKKSYHYYEIYPLFKYRRVYAKGYPQSITLSNFIDVSKW